MTRNHKLQAHLDHIMFEDAPEGTRLNGVQVQALMDVATLSQKIRAYLRGLKHIPFLLDEERIYTGSDWPTKGE